MKINEEVASGIRVFESWTESQMAYSGQPGISVAILKDQDIIWSKGFGYADLKEEKKATPQTIYRIASITKLFTSTAIMQLRDKGKLNIQDPITEHLPWFKIGKKNGSPITIENLITHTSGLPREAAGPYWTTVDFPTKEEIIENLPTQEHPLKPWRKWKYSNLALSLAGYIVEETSGKPYEGYLEENIFKPLEMHDTYIKDIPADHPRLAKGYGRRMPDLTREDSPYTSSRGINPAANMATTVLDLAKFAMLQFREDNPVLDGETLREMHRVHWLAPSWDLGWGLGFNVLRIDGKTYHGHGGSVPGYRTNLRINLEDKVAVIVFTNAGDGDPVKYSEKAFKWIAPGLTQKHQDKQEIEFERYTGKFRNRWSDLQIMEYNGELIAIDPRSPEPLEDYTKMEHIEGDMFKMISSGYGNHNEYAIYEFEDEKIKRLKTGENYTYPVEEW
ncbi:serine hydrolase [Candidatus Bathyarchaeota archaeon]|nr:serine hydrolase [Candidatus Bathyarchaeota archaeon]